MFGMYTRMYMVSSLTDISFSMYVWAHMDMASKLFTFTFTFTQAAGQTNHMTTDPSMPSGTTHSHETAGSTHHD